MRIALLGDFDTFLIRGRDRPTELLPYHLEPGLNLLRGLRDLGTPDVHILVVTPEVNAPIVEDGPLGIVHRLPCPCGSGSASFYFWRRRILLDELCRLQPDIVHGQGTEREYAFTAVTSPYPHVVTLHGIMRRVHEIVPPPLFSLSHVPRWLERLVFRRARHIICLSRGAERYLRHCHSPSRTHVVPNAIGSAFFAVTPQLRVLSEPSLLFVGTIYPLKGLLYLVEAIPLIEKQLGGPVRLRIIGARGGGREAIDYDRAIRERARHLAVDTRIEWAGVCRAEDVARALAQSDVMVLPSLCENMPMCIAEAMAAGIPVVSTTAPFIPDLVQNGVTGLLVRPGSTVELAEAISKILQDPALSQRLKTAARRHAQSEFTPASVATRTLAVYDSIL